MAGLMAASALVEQGADVTVLDKGRGIGGRLATRRIRHPLGGEGSFDYGALSFTATTPLFQTWVDRWLAAGVLQPCQWQTPSDAEVPGSVPGLVPKAVLELDPTPHYCGRPSQRGLAQFLAESLQVHLQTQVNHLAWHTDTQQWQVSTTTGTVFSGDQVLITAPMPQVLTLLHHSELALDATAQTQLETVAYTQCIAVLGLMPAPSLLAPPGLLRVGPGDLAAVACNFHKGVSPEGYAVTLHASDAFSRQHWETEDAKIAELLFEQAQPWLQGSALEWQVHRWRFCQPDVFYPASYLNPPHLPSLYLAGDSFRDPEAPAEMEAVESACLSGLAVAAAMLRNQV